MSNTRRPSRQPNADGLCDKDDVCRAWLADRAITVEQAHALVPEKAEVTVRSWLRRFAYELETGEPPEDCPGRHCVPKGTRELWHRLRTEELTTDN